MGKKKEKYLELTNDIPTLIEIQKCVWHDVTELPESGNHVTVMFPKGGVASCYYNGSREDIKEAFKASGVIKWAYSDDLLPDKEDEK